MSIFALSSQKMDWLAQRHTVIAQNVANANTPGYKTSDVTSFNGFVETAASTVLNVTDTRHLQPSAGLAVAPAAEGAAGWDPTHTSNDVSLENEMLKAGEVRAEFSLASSIQKTFHRLTLAAARGPS